MQAQSARFWLVRASLLITGGTFGFLVVAPALGYPLQWQQTIRLIEIIAPTFLGYLGSATQFVLNNPAAPIVRQKFANSSLLRLLVRGPVIAFALIAVSALVVFGFTNRSSAPQGVGMSLDILAGVISAALGILAVTTSALSAKLFGSAGP